MNLTIMTVKLPYYKKGSMSYTLFGSLKKYFELIFTPSNDFVSDVGYGPLDIIVGSCDFLIFRTDKLIFLNYQTLKLEIK